MFAPLLRLFLLALLCAAVMGTLGLTGCHRHSAVEKLNRDELRASAQAHEAARRYAEADAVYSTLLSAEPSGPDLMARASVRRRMHRWTEAMEDQQRARQLDPGDPAVQRGAELWQRLEQILPEIRPLDARLAVVPEDDQLFADRALLFLRARDPELALEDSDAAGRLAPWAMRPRLLRALALIELGRADECDGLGVEKTLRLEKLETGFFDTIARLDADISADRENAELRAARAWHLNEIGQPRLALEDTEAAFGHDEKSAATATESSYALAKVGRGEESFERAKMATDLDPKSATAWQYRGELEMQRGDPNAAIDSLSRALAINHTAAALRKREECYRQLNLTAQADKDRHALEQLNEPSP